MATALVSALLGREVDSTLAMTGEISLQGRVLPIGGLKEKLMAAVRSGVKTVLIPEKNAKDIAEIEQEIVSKLEIVPVAHMDEVLHRALALDPLHLAAAAACAQHPTTSQLVTH